MHGSDPQLPHTFLPGEAGTDTLALLFPGLAYRATMPLLHYAQRALQWRGADVLRLDLAYDLDPAFAEAGPEARRQRIRDDAERALALSAEHGDHRRVVLVGKSLGTLALADLLDGALADPAPACVWLTPILRDQALVAAIRQRRPPSLFVIGTADPLYDAALVDDLAAGTGGHLVVVEGADHGMELQGDLRATAKAVEAYAAGLDAFLDACLGAAG